MAYKLTIHLRDSPYKDGNKNTITKVSGEGYALENYFAVTIHVPGRGNLSFPWSNILSVENHGEDAAEKIKAKK